MTFPSVYVEHVTFPGNWEALYIQGERVWQGHNLDTGTLLSHLEGKIVAGYNTEYNDVSLTKEFGAEAPKEYSQLPPA